MVVTLSCSITMRFNAGAVTGWATFIGLFLWLRGARDATVPNYLPRSFANRALNSCRHAATFTAVAIGPLLLPVTRT